MCIEVCVCVFQYNLRLLPFFKYILFTFKSNDKYHFDAHKYICINKAIILFVAVNDVSASCVRSR